VNSTELHKPSLFERQHIQNLILGEDFLPENTIFRGGSIDYIKNLDDIENVKTIINLRNGADYEAFNIDYYHFPMSNKVEKYQTNLKEVRIWLNSIIKVFEEDELKYPLLIHCLSGKDRTGIVVAALLTILGVDRKVIEEEYLLSKGKISVDLIRCSLNGLGNIEQYFNRINLVKIRRDNILNNITL